MGKAPCAAVECTHYTCRLARVHEPLFICSINLQYYYTPKCSLFRALFNFIERPRKETEVNLHAVSLSKDAAE